MVDLPTCQTAMRSKKPARRFIHPDEFYIARKRAGLSKDMAAKMLDVDIRTVRNWEGGKSPIPYAAFRVMRLAGGYSLMDKGWEGWALWDGKLFSPAGRSFEPHELTYLGNYLAMARLFIKSRTDHNSNPSADSPAASAHSARRQLKPAVSARHESSARGEASGATAPAGASLRHDTAVVIAADFGQQKGGRRSANGSLLLATSVQLAPAANDARYA